MSDYWINPNRVSFTPKQIKFILSFYSEIREGLWPAEPIESGYTVAPISKRHTYYSGNREVIITVAAVVGLKLKPTEKDGELCVELYDGTYWDGDLLQERKQALSRKHNLAEEEIDIRTNCAIKYASRMTQAYGNFKKQYREHYYEFYKEAPKHLTKS